MMHPADLARLTRDTSAGFPCNDNRPVYYDDEEGVSEWMRETSRSLLRSLGYAAYTVAVLTMMVVAFNIGRGTWL